MSFLLDALRKSENQKRRGLTPTIHSTSELETRRPAQRRLGLILVIVLPALLVLTWFGLKDFLPGKLKTEAPGQGKPSVQATGELAQQELAQIPIAAGEKIRLSNDRTPVEIYSTPPQAAVRNEPASGGQPAINQAQPSVALKDPAQPVPAAADEPTLVPTTPGQNQNQDLAVSVAPRSSPAAQERRGSEQAGQESATISYWQLPESIRSELAGMRISVMVFSARPEERFILMNGKRLVEGDEPQRGLVLEEIRREGAVFSFRLYRFLVER